MRICSVSECETKHCGLGYCHKHYERLKKYGDPLKIIRIQPPETCTLTTCNNKYKGLGFCEKHYRRLKRHGNTDKSYIKKSKPERFLESILAVNGIQYESQKKIIGKPDFFIEPNICIFEDGCYYHGCITCKSEKSIYRQIPQANIKNDKKVNKELKKQGYKIIRIWEHEIYENPMKCFNKIKEII